MKQITRGGEMNQDETGSSEKLSVVERLRRRTLPEHGGCVSNALEHHWNLTRGDSELHADAAGEICRLREELAETEELRQRMAALLTGVAVALRGPEPPLTKWSWHDLPERVAAISRPAPPPAQ